ncbi:hypothetical protein [Modestobacter lapidis]|nr:hypothetical protein [Modestobacter lapidis]
MSDLISVQLDVLDVLLDELSALGAELGQEGELGAVTGRTLGTALDGAVGAAAGDTGALWATGLAALATRVLAVTATLDAALSSYRAADAALAGRLGAGRPGLVVAR